MWICIALLGAGCAAENAPPSAVRPPNVVLIMADDLGYGDLGVFGQEKIRTPRLDRMAAEGTRFTSFYAGSTVCAPSRSALMTGRHTGHTFVRGNGVLDLPDEIVTVAEVLRDAGYATGMVGKWGLGHEGSQGMPTRQGFDFFYGYLDQVHAHAHYPAYLVRGEAREALGNVVPEVNERGFGRAVEQVDYAHDRMAEEALGFIERHRDEPFFLYAAFTLPHAELLAPEDAMALYRDDGGASVFEEEPYPGAHYSGQPQPRAAYAAMVSRLDRDVGRILDALDRHGIGENTLVLFTSDNGPHEAGGNDPHFFDSNGPLRGIKRDLYEGGIRVPTIARWPARVEAGRTSDHVAYFPDVMPTLAALAGAAPPAGTDGVSFLPALMGEGTQPEHDYLYWEFYERGSAQAVRMGDWKAVRQPMLTGPVELYDLAADPGETRDVAADHPEVVARALAAMEEAHEPSPHWHPPVAE